MTVIHRISYSDIYLFIYLFVDLQVGAQLILLHLRGAQMTLVAFQEQVSFKFFSENSYRKVLAISVCTATSSKPMVHTRERHADRKSLIKCTFYYFAMVIFLNVSKSLELTNRTQMPKNGMRCFI